MRYRPEDARSTGGHAPGGMQTAETLLERVEAAGRNTLPAATAPEPSPDRRRPRRGIVKTGARVQPVQAAGLRGPAVHSISLQEDRV